MIAWALRRGLLRWENSRIGQGRPGSCSPANGGCENPRTACGNPYPTFMETAVTTLAGFALWANTRNGTWPSGPALREVGLLGEREPAGLGGAAGQAGARKRAREVAAGAVGRRRELRALGRAAGRHVGPEHVLL